MANDVELIDVEMPDGVILSGVPANLSKSQVMARYLSHVNQDRFKGSTLQIATPFKTFDTGVPLPPEVFKPLAGAGKFFHDTGLGLRRNAASLGEHVGMVEPATVEKMNQQVRDERAQDAPLMATGGGKLGYGGAAVLSTLAFPAGTVPRALALGAGMGLAAPAASDAEAAMNTGLGAGLSVVGQQVASGIGRVVAGPKVDPARRAAIDLARQQGFITTPAAQTGSRTLARLEGALQTTPGSSGVAQRVVERNTNTANQIMNKSIAEIADTGPTPEVLAHARMTLGQGFDTFKGLPTRVALDPVYLGQVRAVGTAQQQLAPSLRSPDVARLVHDFAPTIPTRMKTATVQANRSILAKQAADAFKSGDSTLGNAKQAVVDAIDGAVERSLAPEHVAAWQQLRYNWKNLLALEKVPDPTGMGNISPLRLGPALRQQNPVAFAEGSGGLIDLARSAQVLKDTISNSGTPERSQAIQWITNHPIGALGALSGAGAGIGGASGGKEGAITGAALPFAAAAVPWAIARGYYNPAVSSVISRGMLPRLQNATVGQILLRSSRGLGLAAPGMAGALQLRSE